MATRRYSNILRVIGWRTGGHPTRGWLLALAPDRRQTVSAEGLQELPGLAHPLLCAVPEAHPQGLALA